MNDALRAAFPRKLAVCLGLVAGLVSCDLKTVSSSIENVDETAYRVEPDSKGGELLLRIPASSDDVAHSYSSAYTNEPPPGYSPGVWQEQVTMVSIPTWGTSQEYWYGWFLLHLFAVDRSWLPDPRNFRSEGLESLYVAATRDTNGFHDRFTRYYPPELGPRLTSALSGSSNNYRFGFFLRTFPSDTVVVGSVVLGGPADNAGLKRDDRVLDVDGLVLDSALSRLDQKTSTNHVVRIYRPSAARTIALNVSTAKVTYPSVFADTMPGGVGYIAITQFVSEAGSTTDGLFAKALDEMQSLRRDKSAWILDLRDNGGGTIVSSQGVAGSLLGPSVNLVRVHLRDVARSSDALYGLTTDTIYTSPASAQKNRPSGRMFFLQNGGTASASELLLSSLRENLSSTEIVTYGTLSYGKGIGQIYVSSQLGGYFAVTCMHLDPLRAARYHHVGISPDVTTPADSILVRALADIVKPAAGARGIASSFALAGVSRADRWNLLERQGGDLRPLIDPKFPGSPGIF